MQPEQYRLPFNHHPFKGKYNSYEQADSIKKCLLPKSRQRLGTADIPKLVVTLYTEV